MSDIQNSRENLQKDNFEKKTSKVLEDASYYILPQMGQY
jgi:hypothetical protein